MLSVLLLACSPESPPDLTPARDGEPDPPSLPAVDEPFAPAAAAELGQVAPDFALETADGIFHLYEREGDVIFMELAGFF